MSIDKADAITLQSYWPTKLLPRTRKWVSKLLLGGQITSQGKFTLSFKDKKTAKNKQRGFGS